MPIKDEKIGYFFRDLLSDSSWIARRVEHISLVSSDESRHFVSLDIDLKVLKKKYENAGFSSYQLCEIPVPLGLVEKSLYLDFNVQNTNGCSMSLLTRDENSHIAQSVILAAAKTNNVPVDEMDPRLLDNIQNIAGSDPSRQDLQAIYGMKHGREGTVSGWEVPRTFVDQQQSWLKLFEQQECLSWFIAFTMAFMPVVRVPYTPQSGRSIVKYSFLESDTVRETYLFRKHLLPIKIFNGDWWSSCWDAIRYAWQVIPEHLSLKSRAAFFEVKGVGFAPRDHIRISAPDGTFFTKFNFYESPTEYADEFPDPLDEFDSPRSSVNPASPAMRYKFRVAPQTLVMEARKIPRTSWTLETYFRPSLDGFALPAVVTVTLTALVLLTGGIQQLISEALERSMYINGQLNNNAVSLIALLLLVPTLFSAFLARGGEHQLRAESMFLLRLGVGCCGAANVIAALSLIAGMTGTTLGWTWAILGVGALGFTLILILARHKEKVSRDSVISSSMKTQSAEIRAKS